MLLYQILAYTLHGKYKKSHIRTINLMKNEEFKLADESYSVSDIQDYFEYIFKNMEKRLLILQ